jgi:site-specific recombinase XerD
MAGQVVALHEGKTIADAADAFLSRDMAVTTRRSYAQTMHRLTAEHGTLPVGALDSAILDAFTAAMWGECGPATWNRHVATLRSFTAFARRHGWLAGDPAGVLERRTEPADRTKAIARS